MIIWAPNHCHSKKITASHRLGLSELGVSSVASVNEISKMTGMLSDHTPWLSWWKNMNFNTKIWSLNSVKPTNHKNYIRPYSEIVLGHLFMSLINTVKVKCSSLLFQYQDYSMILLRRSYFSQKHDMDIIQDLQVQIRCSEPLKSTSTFIWSFKVDRCSSLFK